jgi:starch phosphorylase
MPERVAVVLEGRTVHVRAWKCQATGISGFVVPVYLLDTDLPENAEWDRTLTHYLYGGDQHAHSDESGHAFRRKAAGHSD